MGPIALVESGMCARCPLYERILPSPNQEPYLSLMALNGCLTRITHGGSIYICFIQWFVRGFYLIRTYCFSSWRLLWTLATITFLTHCRISLFGLGRRVKHLFSLPMPQKRHYCRKDVTSFGRQLWTWHTLHLVPIPMLCYLYTVTIFIFLGILWDQITSWLPEYKVSLTSTSWNGQLHYKVQQNDSFCIFWERHILLPS